MKEDVIIIKESLRIIDSKYVDSKQIDEGSFEITFEYKNRNYKLYINSKYKLITLSTIESIYGLDFNNDTLELVDYISLMLLYTMFDEYNLSSFSIRREKIKDVMFNSLQIINYKGDYNTISEVSNTINNNEEYTSSLIPYDIGLDCFDKRLFNDNVFEDFSEKLSTYNDEELYIMCTTFIGYFYKVVSKKWNDNYVDPFIINEKINIIYYEILKRNIEFESWYKRMEEYFTKENIEIYLDNKVKSKNKGM